MRSDILTYMRLYKGRNIYGSGLRSELRSCVKVEVAVVGSLSLVARTVSVDVKNIKLSSGFSTEESLSDFFRFIVCWCVRIVACKTIACAERLLGFVLSN